MNHVLALDVGGTGMKAALLASDGSLGAQTTRPTLRGRGPDAVVAGLLDFAAELLADARSRTGRAPVAAGVAVPGNLDDEHGIARYSANLGWRDVPLRDLLTDRLGLPVTLSHDLRAGGVAEARLGAARGHGRFVFLALGTGVAGAIGIDGRIETGAHGRAGEVGHVVVRPGGLRCGCGAYGCLETLASAAAVARAYTAAGGPAGSSAQDVARAVERGEERAAAVWQEAVEALADGVLLCAAVLDPEVFVIGGGLALAGPTLFGPLGAAIARRVTFHVPPVVVPAALGAAAGCVGAGLLAWDEFTAGAGAPRG
ncbi:ROK family protein [Kitasatospora kazusensis]|uniref:ROK family protein n=1 Tax=Kitasatospora kazusensis TaxID=407974 RepID=A0ABN2ZKG6_9ACTN